MKSAKKTVKEKGREGKTSLIYFRQVGDFR